MYEHMLADHVDGLIVLRAQTWAFCSTGVTTGFHVTLSNGVGDEVEVLGECPMLWKDGRPDMIAFWKDIGDGELADARRMLRMQILVDKLDQGDMQKVVGMQFGRDIGALVIDHAKLALLQNLDGFEFKWVQTLCARRLLGHR